VGRFVLELRLVEAAIPGAATEVAGTDFPHQIPARPQVILRQAALTGVVRETAPRRTRVQRQDRVADSDPKLIAETLSRAMS
jgi:hypothetical protein